MRRAVANRITDGDPAEVIEVVDVPEPTATATTTLVHVRSVALNQHDLWAIKGVGVKAEQFPLGLGSDVAGVTADGREVLVHALVITDPMRAGGSELTDPGRGMLAEASGGGAAEVVLVPTRNLVDKPASLGFDEACCLPTAWLTAYHMLFGKARAQPGQTVLIQGAGGGVSTAAITLGVRAGLRVWVTGRDEGRRNRAAELGAELVLPTGTRLAQRADIVLETVGAATFDHSIRSVRPGGVIVVAGATTGGVVSMDLNRIFLQHVSILGSSMGTIDDLRSLVSWCAAAGIAPTIDSVHPLPDAAVAVARLASGDAVGKVVLHP